MAIQSGTPLGPYEINGANVVLQDRVPNAC